jgi:CubicO group peptidase (beta-lactamase class C family)
VPDDTTDRRSVRESHAMGLRPLPSLLLCAASASFLFAGPARVALPRSSPEAEGIASSAILDFVAAAEQKIDALHSFMLLRHGKVVAEGWWAPYRKDDPHVLFSLSKSFTSTGVGLAIAEGKLTLDDRVLDAFPEFAPAEPSANLEALRVRDLLTMSTGHHAEAIAGFPFGSEESLPRLFLALPVAHKPGTHFVYNTPATYMLSAMVQKATGSTLVEYLRPRLFEPLGIESPRWDADRHGVTLGGFGLRLRSEDIARFGQLYLQEGQWQGRQLVPAGWIAAATARQVSNGSDPESDWEQGYGYQFWRCRHGLYRGDGAFGQFCIVMPEQDAVVAITSGTSDLGGVMNLVWQHLLPALRGGVLPADAVAEQALRRKLASLTLRPQAGGSSSPLARKVSGKRYLFPANDDGIEAVGLDTRRGTTTLVLRRAGSETAIPMGQGAWGPTVVLPMPGEDVRTAGEEKAAASGAWTADDCYTAKVCLQETPFVLTLALQFKGDELALDQQMNVAFGETKRPRLTGRRSAASSR